MLGNGYNATRADTVFVGMVVLYQSPEYRVHLRIPCSQIGESLFFFFTSNNPRGCFTVQCNEWKTASFLAASFMSVSVWLFISLMAVMYQWFSKGFPWDSQDLYRVKPISFIMLRHDERQKPFSPCGEHWWGKHWCLHPHEGRGTHGLFTITHL